MSNPLDQFRENPDEFNKFVEGAEKAALAPPGWYVTIPQHAKRVNDDGNSVRVYGKVRLEELDNKWKVEHPEDQMNEGVLEIQLGYNIGLNPANLSAFANRLTTNAVRAFTQAYGKKCSGPDEVLDYLCNYPVRLRVVHGKANEEKGYPASNMVAQIAPVK